MKPIKKTFAITAFVLSAFFVFVDNSFAGTYYVAANGSATWANCEETAATPGPKSDNAACSFVTANQYAKAGDTVYYRGGSYTISRNAIDPANTGTAGNRITFAAYGDEVVEFVNTSTSTSIYAVNLNSDYGTVRSHITVKGIKFTNFNRHLWILRGQYNEVSHCSFIGTAADGGDVGWRGSTIYRSAKYNHIHHNVFKLYGSYEGGNDHGTLFELGIDNQNDDNSSYNIIENNILSGGGHHVLGVHGNHNVVKNNYFHNESWWPISSPQYGNRIIYFTGGPSVGYRNLVEGNRVAYGGETSETNQIGGAGGTIGSPYNIIRRNVFYKTLIYGLWFYKYSFAGGGHDNKVYNNTFWSNAYTTSGPTKSNWTPYFQTTIFVDEKNTVNVNNDFINNIFYQNNNYCDSAKPITQTYDNGWCKEPDTGTLANNWIGEVAGDPKFNNISGTPDPNNKDQFDFSLQPNSGAIDGGGYLTKITSATGSGTTFQVADAGSFFDGWGLTSHPTASVEPDRIQLEGQDLAAKIVKVDYSTNTITVDTNLSWASGQGVTLAFKGSAPDIGAHEHVYSVPVPEILEATIK